MSEKLTLLDKVDPVKPTTVWIEPENTAQIIDILESRGYTFYALKDHGLKWKCQIAYPAWLIADKKKQKDAHKMLVFRASGETFWEAFSKAVEDWTAGVKKWREKYPPEDKSFQPKLVEEEIN